MPTMNDFNSSVGKNWKNLLGSEWLSKLKTGTWHGLKYWVWPLTLRFLILVFEFDKAVAVMFLEFLNELVEEGIKDRDARDFEV